MKRFTELLRPPSSECLSCGWHLKKLETDTNTDVVRQRRYESTDVLFFSLSNAHRLLNVDSSHGRQFKGALEMLMMKMIRAEYENSINVVTLPERFDGHTFPKSELLRKLSRLFTCPRGDNSWQYSR